MTHVVTKAEAAAVMPFLRAHAAALLEPINERATADLAVQLRAGLAGGNAIEAANQNFDHAGDGSWPEELDTFWRVLFAFEEVALGGHVRHGGRIDPLRGEPEQPRPWMLHAAAHALTSQGALPEIAETYRAVGIPAYRPI